MDLLFFKKIWFTRLLVLERSVLMSLLRCEVVDLLNLSIDCRLEFLECGITELFAEEVEEKLIKKYNIKFNCDSDCFE